MCACYFLQYDLFHLFEKVFPRAAFFRTGVRKVLQKGATAGHPHSGSPIIEGAVLTITYVISYRVRLSGAERKGYERFL
jgi:hypothetical protein